MKCVTERDGKIRILVDTNILFSALVFPVPHLRGFCSTSQIITKSSCMTAILQSCGIYSRTEGAKASPGCGSVAGRDVL